MIRGLRSLWKELYEYFTYDHYGKRKPRPAFYGVVLTLLVAAGMFAAAGLLALRAPRGEGPAPTLPPPTKTAIFATVTAQAARPTNTPAPLCPEDPALWQLVEVKPFLDPKTGKPVQLPKPIYRIDPPCVYQSLWRDIARRVFLKDPPAPTVEKEVENVPWYWEPGPEISRWPFKPARANRAFIFYDRNGRKIDEVFTIYTVLPTGDRDYPVIAYIYRDYPNPAYAIQWEEGRITKGRPVRLSGGTVLRRVGGMFYDARGRHWVVADYIGGGYPRALHATTADGSGLWEALGVKGTTRSELARAFGMEDFFPETVDLKQIPMGDLLEFGP